MSRDTILARIRATHGKTRSDSAERAAVQTRLAQRARGPLPRLVDEPATQFAARARSLASTVIGPVPLADVPGTVARYLDELRLPKKAVCWDVLALIQWTAVGIEVESRPARADDTVGITGAFCAIAETGTLMLLSGEQTPATTSLLPETHIALVPLDRIVPYMEDGFDLMRREFGSVPRAINFVSGPSRTADIEQTVTLGAHGPYRVLIVLVG
jgi:L-lactate dehydrogenase complex protein LldG